MELGSQAARGRAKGGAPVVCSDVKGSVAMDVPARPQASDIRLGAAISKTAFRSPLRRGLRRSFGDPRHGMTRGRWTQGSDRPSVRKSVPVPHKLGSVALAHSGIRASRSRFNLRERPARYAPPNFELNGKYAVIGQVTSGMPVVQQLRVLDIIRKATVKAPGRGAK